MKKYLLSLAAALCLAGHSLTAHADVKADSLAIAGGDALGSRYTVEVRSVRLASASDTLLVRVGRKFASASSGITLCITSDGLYGIYPTRIDTVAHRLPDGLDTHHYTLVRSTTKVQVYRDNTLLGTLTEGAISLPPQVCLFGAGSLADAPEVILTPSQAIVPDEVADENNIANMLPATCTNLVEDPYCNRGFLSSGENTDKRDFISQSAIYSGWGPNAYIDSEQAYSGRHSICLYGQAAYPNLGAALYINVSLTGNTPYYIRAMVKSEGYRGRITAENCQGAIEITDTRAEWKQVEGVLIPTATSSRLEISNAAFTNSGTLHVDNIEVYKGYRSTTAVGTEVHVPYLTLSAGDTWKPTKETQVYMLGFTDNGTQVSAIDTSVVKMVGGTQLKKQGIQGSRLYAMYFPGDLQGMSVSGHFDGFSHENMALEYGVDYILQQYTYPRFDYMDTGIAIEAGNYLVQFVDNLENTDVTFTFGKKNTLPESDRPYRLVGNETFLPLTPEGRYYRFDEEQQRFLLTSGETLKPFEAYIETDATVPVNQIVPAGQATRLQRVYDANGTKITIRSTEGGIVAYAAEAGTLTIYAPNGQVVKSVSLRDGANTILLSRGFYLADGCKIIVK